MSKVVLSLFSTLPNPLPIKSTDSDNDNRLSEFKVLPLKKPSPSYDPLIGNVDYKGSNSPTYGGNVITEYRKTTPNKTLLNQINLKKSLYNGTYLTKLDPYSGIFKAQEFFNIIYNESNSNSGDNVIYDKLNKSS